MRLGIKAKQVLGVTAIVGVVVVALTVWHLTELAEVSVRESQARADMLSNMIFERAREVIGEGKGSSHPFDVLRGDPGLQSILKSSVYAGNVTFAAIVDVADFAIAHADPGLVGQRVPEGRTLDLWLDRSPLSLLWVLYSEEAPNLEVRLPLRIDATDVGSIRIGVSTVLIRQDLRESLVEPALTTALIALGIAVVGAMLLSQVLLRPIHVIRSGLTRLGSGELGVRLDLNQQDEFGELGTFFNTVSARLTADRKEMAGQVASLESAVDHLEDAVAIVSPTGELLFVNPAMRTLVPGATVGEALRTFVPEGHALLRLADETLVNRQPRGPVNATFPMATGDPGSRLILTHPVHDASGALVGILLIARNLEYLSQVESTLRYSRKLAALGRLSAGVAHEVKNPLNAMMIHLELLRQEFESKRHTPGSGNGAREHLDVIAGEIRRLDEVVQGFLKFTRPEDLSLQAVSLPALCREVLPIIQREAERINVTLVFDCANAPDINGDPTMLRQAFLNLALNACQAMPRGGTLTIRGEAARGRRVLVTVSDTGTGIDPSQLGRIFDLYFTTKKGGSGIGLSMVYRTIQMHDGEIEVESTVGKGTQFRILLPQA